MPMTSMLGPVERLAKLLGDAAQVDEKIHDAMDALMLIKKRVSESLAQRYVAMKDYRFQMPEDLMKEEQSYERLLQALQEMKAEIAKQIRPGEEQIIHANAAHLRQTFNPDGLPSADLGDIVRQRIEHLRSQGKV